MSGKAGAGKAGQGAKPSNNLAQFKYAAMSNLVLQADRRFVTRRNDDATGDPESLAGRIDIKEMGARMARDSAPSQKRKQPFDVQRAPLGEGAEVLRQQQKRAKAETGVFLSQADLAIEGLRYRPRTAATRATYELITTMVARSLGDVPAPVVRSASDAVLEYLKDDDLKDYDKKKEVDDILGSTLTSKEFNELVNLSKKITDYEIQDDDEAMTDGEDGAEAELDDKQGVAVVFDEEDDEEGAGQTFEVRDGDESSEDGASGFDNDEKMLDDEANQVKPAASAEDDAEMLIQTGGDHAVAEAQQVDTIPAYDIDAYWLQRQVGQVYQDAHTRQEKTQDAFALLSGFDNEGEEKPLREIENDLMELFDYEHHEIVARLVQNRDKIVWVTKWRRVAENQDERSAVEREMVANGHGRILQELRTREASAPDDPRAERKMKVDLSNVAIPAEQQPAAGNTHKETTIGGLQPRRLLNLENLVFDQGNHLMTNANVKLPQGSTKRTFKGYEEIHVPAPVRKKSADDRPNMPTSQLPDWARTGFGASSKELNRIQTKCYPMAFEDDGNMLICAPTGSGKTNVAMLAMLREIGKHRDPETGEIDLDAFKIIFIAPLKALVAEQVGNFGARLQSYGIKVAELTGDRQLTKQQIAETQIIVTTPEKWDVITRKATDTSYTTLVRLICIDEIHLLHDDRGPVIESIVSRTIRRTEQTGDPVRLVGLSATLPNYRDVASFLRVDPLRGLFHFDSSFRPCPLKQEFIGLTDRKAIKQLKTMNDVCYKKVLEQVGDNRNQLIIFVHSRKETAKTAKYIRDKALEEDTIGKLLQADAAEREIIRGEVEDIADTDFKDLAPYGFGIHHAGMTRADRTSAEELFGSGALRVLVSTATLAWGVNLPAHTVIIKGTQIYSPEKGSWVELSPQDVLQMLGRAGRPQHDTFGEGIVITTQTEMQYYLSLMNQQLPIESQFMSKLADNLNAEVVLGNVRTRDEGVEWLGYSYLFVRMLRSPGLYSVGAEYQDDEALEQKRVDLIHSAATVLEKCNLVKYDKRSGRLQATELGKIASHYYISHSSMLTYNQHIQPSISPIELFRVFSLSEEFKYIPVRQDEKLELAKLLGRVPIPVKETIEESHCKINVLLQAYISRLKLEGLALMADLVYVTQSAGRILRAIFEICLKRGWASVAKTALDLCKMAEKRMWPTMTPLRQFVSCPRDIIQKAERIDVPWSSYFDLDPPRMSELLGMPKAGRIVCPLVAKFPRLDVKASVQPLTRSIMHVELTIAPAFEWDDAIHGAAETFWILVEDCDGEEILYHDQFLLRRDYALSEASEHIVEFTVAITEPMPPNYFITVIADRWMGSETKLPISFQKVILPEKFSAPTQLLDLQPLPTASFKDAEYATLYPGWDKFNKIETQVFQALYNSSDNVFLGASTGNGKTTCAEFAILRHWKEDDHGKAVYIAPFDDVVEQRRNDWENRFSNLKGGKTVAKLSGELTADLRAIDSADLILATPQQWDAVSRQWQRRKNVQAVRLFIADDLHMLGSPGGQTYEVIVSRTHAMAVQLQSELRIVGLSIPLANARDVGEWIGAKKHTIFNFATQHRAVPIELHIQAFSIPHFPSLMLAMAKPAYKAIVELSPDKPAIIFVPNRKQARSSALDLLSACVADDDEDRFLNAPRDQLEPFLERINERALIESLKHGIGYIHEALDAVDKRIVERLYKLGAIQVLLVSRESCWELNCNAHLVVILGTQYYEGRQHRYVDYSIPEVLQMLGKAGRIGVDKVGRGVLMLPSVKRDYYKKFLNEPLPVESQLQDHLSDAFVTEVSTKLISSTQDAVDWMTYTYFYPRLLANPSYYGLTDVSNEGLNAYLSEMVEETLQGLAQGKIIELDDEDGGITPLNPCMIAAYYDISSFTIQTFLLSLSAKTRLKGILEIVSSASEFEDIQIRRHEEPILRRIYQRVPVKMADANFDSPNFKAFVLLQAHFSRLQLPADLIKDQEMIVRKTLKLLSACVDVLSSEGHLNAMGAMEMSQMVVQAMWDRDSVFKQIPHFDDRAIAALKSAGIDSMEDFADAMDPDENPAYEKLVKSLGLNNQQLGEAAEFTNDRYPNLELSFEVIDGDDVRANAPAHLSVTVRRGLEEDEEAQTSVHAPFYPAQKTENWWLIIGNEASRSLYAIKRVNVDKVLTTRLEFVVPEAGKQELTLFLMSDSYVGVDQAPTFVVEVAEGMDEDEDEEEGEDEE